MDQNLSPVTNRSLDSISQEFRQQYKDLNPRATDDQMVSDWLYAQGEAGKRAAVKAQQDYVSNQQGPGVDQPGQSSGNPFIDQLRNAFHGVSSAATEGVTTVLGAPHLAVNKLNRLLGIIPEDQKPDLSGERLVASAIVPQTGGQGGAGLVNAAPLPAWVKVPAAAAAGYLGSKATGEEGLRPAIDALAGGAAVPLAATIKGTTSAVQRFAGLGSGETAARSLSEDAAGNLAAAIKNDAPELGAAMSGKGSVPEQLLDLQRTGPKALSTMMESTENQIVAALPNAKIQVAGAPAMWPNTTPAQSALLTAKFGPPPQSAGAGVNLKDAFSELQNLKDKAYYLKTQRDRGTLGNLDDYKAAMDQVNTLQKNIENAITDPKLLATWKAAVAKYDYGKRYLDLANSALAGEEAAGAPFNIAAMVKAYLQDVKSFGRLPSERKIFGGGELGTQPTMSHVGVPFIGHLPTAMPGLNIYGRGPGMSFITQPGRLYGYDLPPAMMPGFLGSLGSMGRSALSDTLRDRELGR